MSALAPIDSTMLQTVTGGGSRPSPTSGIDSLLAELSSMTSSLNNFKNKTSGLDQGSMLVLCMLAMRRNSGVVYVQSPGAWW